MPSISNICGPFSRYNAKNTLPVRFVDFKWRYCHTVGEPIFNTGAHTYAFAMDFQRVYKVIKMFRVRMVLSRFDDNDDGNQALLVWMTEIESSWKGGVSASLLVPLDDRPPSWPSIFSTRARPTFNNASSFHIFFALLQNRVTRLTITMKITFTIYIICSTYNIVHVNVGNGGRTNFGLS